jgi:hypothetical protein
MAAIIVYNLEPLTNNAYPLLKANYDHINATLYPDLPSYKYHLVISLADEKVKRVEDEHPIALATLRNEQPYKEASEVRQQRFEEALDKEAYQALGNFFYLMKEYRSCRKLAERDESEQESNETE